MYELLSNTETRLKLAAALHTAFTAERLACLMAVAKECDIQGLTSRRQLSYIIATLKNECDFKSIPERRAKKGTVAWRAQEAYWHTGYYGRGYCQLTWDYNYEKFGKLLKLDLHICGGCKRAEYACSCRH